LKLAKIPTVYITQFVKSVGSKALKVGINTNYFLKNNFESRDFADETHSLLGVISPIERIAKIYCIGGMKGEK